MVNGVLVARDVSLRLGCGLHYLTDLMSSISGLDSMELGLFFVLAHSELRNWLDLISDTVYLGVVHSLLVAETAWSVSSFLRSESQVVKLGLLGSHVATISVECTHGSLGTAMQSR